MLVVVLPNFDPTKRHLVVGSFCKEVTFMHQYDIILVGAGSLYTPFISPRDHCILKL